MVCDVLGGLHMMCEKKKKKTGVIFFPLFNSGLFVFVVVFYSSFSWLCQSCLPGRVPKMKIENTALQFCLLQQIFFFFIFFPNVLVHYCFSFKCCQDCKVHPCVMTWPNCEISSSVHAQYFRLLLGLKFKQQQKKKTWSICCKSVMWCKSTC